MTSYDENGDPKAMSLEKTQSNTNMTGDEDNDSPIKQVRLTVPPTDDPTQPTLTFRTWVLGLISCVVLSFVNQFFAYRQNQLSITPVIIQILVLSLGKLMSAYLPSKPIRVPLTNWSFSLNPGPFNLKEHVLITIFANSGADGVYALHIVTGVKAFYHRSISGVAAYILSLTTQMLVSLFRALHEKENRPKGGLTRIQFFFMIFAASFAYYIVPSYFFPSISAISLACLIWKDSVTAQQIGGGISGLGLDSFGLDWSTIASFLGNPLATPGFAIINILVGFMLFVYVVIPIAYWSNAYDAKKFPIFSSHTFDHTGQPYNISRILNEKAFDINHAAYDSYSKLYLSVFFAFTCGLSFATLTATLTHVALFNGKTIWTLWKQTASATKDNYTDVHARLMKKKYKQVPQWWFCTILVLMVGLAMFACEGFDKQLQLPWWGLLMACDIALFFTLPIGIIQATTNTQPGLNVITELVIGYIYPGKALANVAFKTYGYISMSQALYFVNDFKLGHYMKIPPRSMFIVQLVGTLVASSNYFATAWWLLSSNKDICDPLLLPEGSPWTCPGDDVFYNASIIWGVIGPLRMFTKYGIYKEMNWFFLLGFLAPIPGWFLSRKYPNIKWLRLINMPIIIGATSSMPPTKAVNYWAWGAVGIFFNFYIYRKFKAW
nr:oligopeptide transporter 1 [Quercus suber]